MDSNTAIQIENISKRFVIRHDRTLKERLLGAKNRVQREDFLSLDAVSATVSRGETLGLIGHNGSGKSTLLKVIGGILEPSSGRILRRGRLAALLELGAGFNQDLTGRENIFLNAAILGLTRSETRRHLDSIIEFSELEHFIDTQVKFYSSGMYVRLAFAVAIHVDPDILLVDEVLAVGDEPFQRKCLSRIAQFQSEGRTIVLVSHSAEQIAEICSRVLVLELGRTIYQGDVGPGLRALRKSFVARGVTRGEIIEDPSDAPVQIHEVHVAVGDTGENVLVSLGDDISIRVVVEVRRYAAWMCGLNFQTPLGHSTYRVDTNALSSSLPTTPGKYTLEFSIPRANFGSSRLTLAVAVAKPTGELIHRISEAAEIDVRPDRLGRGDLQFAATVRVS